MKRTLSLLAILFLSAQANAENIKAGIWNLTVKDAEKETQLLIDKTGASSFQQVTSAELKDDKIVAIKKSGNLIILLEVSKEASPKFRYRYFSILESSPKKFSLGAVKTDGNSKDFKADPDKGEIGSLVLVK